MQYHLSRRIDELIANAYNEDSVDDDYQKSFANEGIRKAEYIVDDLRYRESKGLVCPDRLAYFCIGGADGSEVEYVLSEIAISKAIMIEISTDGASAANSRAAAIRLHNKEFVVLQGDAMSRLEEALSIVEKWCSSGEIDGLVCSAQGVLHELPTRSPGFDLPVFLGKLFRNPAWRVCAFYSREPSLPADWPEQVRIRIPGLPANQLVRFARYISDRLRMPGNPQPLSSGWVDMPSHLAVETLHKLIREGSIRRIGYELGEQLTGFDPMAVKEHIQTLVEGMHVTVEHVTTSGFKAALRDYRVGYIGHNSTPLPVPKTHSEVIGFMCTAPSQIESQVPLERSFPPSTQINTPFNNPFGLKISDEEIASWLFQFELEERHLIARLLDGFVYLGFDRVQSMAVELHNMLRANLGEAFSRAWYVPVGGVAKSGAFVSYLYRSLNKIEADRFLTYELVDKRVQAGDPVVLIDDLLASGHQAVFEWLSLCKKSGLQKSSSAYLATIVGCKAGNAYVEERTTLETVNVLQLTRSNEPLSSESVLFPDMAEREQLRKILKKYGTALAPRGPLGYAGSGLLFNGIHFNEI